MIEKIKTPEKIIEGHFYYTSEGIEKCHYRNVNGCGEMVTPRGVVLAPVPTYDEYKAADASKTMLEEENKIWSELAENLLCLEEEKWEILVKNGTKEQRLDFLRHKEKYSLLAILDKYERLKKELESARWYQTVQNEDIGKLRGLLKECQLEVKSRLRSLEFTKMTSQSKEPKRECIRLEDLSIRINAALGESEE